MRPFFLRGILAGDNESRNTFSLTHARLTVAKVNRPRRLENYLRQKNCILDRLGLLNWPLAQNI